MFSSRHEIKIYSVAKHITLTTRVHVRTTWFTTMFPKLEMSEARNVTQHVKTRLAIFLGLQGYNFDIWGFTGVIFVAFNIKFELVSFWKLKYRRVELASSGSQCMNDFLTQANCKIIEFSIFLCNDVTWRCNFVYKPAFVLNVAAYHFILASVYSSSASVQFSN
jgi:hypothetical protein